MTAQNLIDDIDEKLKPFEDEEISEANENIDRANLAVTEAAQQIGSLQEAIKNEIEMQQVASKSDFGWATVKELEKDPLFQDDDDGSKTKKLKDANKRAAKAMLQKRSLNKFGGRGGFKGTGGRGGFRGVRGGFVGKARQPYYQQPQQYVLAGGDGAGQPYYQPQQQNIQPQGLQANAPQCWKSVIFFGCFCIDFLIF